MPSNLDARGINKELLFDRRLKEQMQTLDGIDMEYAEKHQRFQKGILSNIKVFMVLVYFVIMPFVWAPSWCINYVPESG